MRTIGLAGIAGAVATALLFATPVAAQSAGAVDCGNGFYCPADNACLMGGLCAPMVDAAPGSVQTSKGNFCDPGFRESVNIPGMCIPGSYSECAGGVSCPHGTECGAEGTCTGGPPPTGPMCGGGQCAGGRICSSRNTCMNTAYFQDCGNGTICSKAAACEFPKGCVLVDSQRTKQVQWRR